jgi:mannose-6-phosphate isomerase-like protein (cupin superfamily)
LTKTFLNVKMSPAKLKQEDKMAEHALSEEEIAQAEGNKMFAVGDVSKSGPAGRLIGNLPGLSDAFDSREVFIRVWEAGKDDVPSQRHAHQDTDEVILALKGALEIEIDGEEIYLASGEFLFKKPGSVSQIVWASNDAQALIIKAPWLPYDVVPK